MYSHGENERVLAAISDFLNFEPCCITESDINGVKLSGVSEQFAYSVLLAARCGLDCETERGKRLLRDYFIPMVKKLDVRDYTENSFYAAMRGGGEAKRGEWELKTNCYEPYEGFVCDDFMISGMLVIPQIGFFTQKFEFPAVTQGGVEWMTVTPNEVNTMREPVDRAFGNVLTYGLGMGYYAYMCAIKPNVISVTVIERDENAVMLFNEYILPRLGNFARKIKIILSDAFEFAEKKAKDYDYIFADIWHDVSDGLDLYLKFKEYEKFSPDARHDYWIEKSIKCYL